MGRTRKGCKGCRDSHSKCDESTPACQRCNKLGLECVRGNTIRFVLAKGSRGERRKSRHQDDADSSMTPPGGYSLDNRKSLETSFEDQSWALANASQGFSSAIVCIDHGCDVRDGGLITTTLHQVIAMSKPQSLPDLIRESHSTSPIRAPSSNLGWLPWKSLPPPTWLRDEREVHILKHYIDVLATWIDFCDVQKTFGVVIPRLAAIHKPLLNAILAVSSRHLSILTGQDVLIAGKYYQDCLGALIPLLNDESAVMNDILLAVLVILYLIEELDSPIGPAGSPVHIQGLRECVRAQGRMAPQSRLCFTSLCVMVRQENYLAIVNMCPIGWDLDCFTIPIDPDPSDELSWTMCVVRLYADLIQFSNDDRSKQDMEKWQYLKTLNEQWNLTKPRSFQAVFAKDADKARGEPFPKTWFLQVWHSVSTQHYHLNRILLAASDPRVPRFGPGHQEAFRQAEDEILSHMRHICGIALLNTNMQPCMVTAYMGISICGDRFTTRLDQEGMFELLTKVNHNFAWPTQNLQKQLKTSWGWES